MASQEGLFPPPSPTVSEGPSTGIFPSHGIRQMLRDKEILPSHDLEPGQIQPASLDLRLSNVAYRLRASFLPGAGVTVESKLASMSLHKIDLTNGALFETGSVYLVPLVERLKLRAGVSATANPKSSTGRLDVFTRLIADGSTAFDQVDEKYDGQLYAEVSPRTFSILVRPGSRLNQIRFRRGNPVRADTEVRQLDEKFGLVTEGKAIVDNGLALRVDLRSNGGPRLIGYRAKHHVGLIDVDRVGAYNVADFWEPIHANSDNSLILDPREFYILASKECIRIPPTYAAEMVPFNPMVGEFRVHYAGFFDPGFGFDANDRSVGARAVLEVRSHEVPFILEDGQTIGHLEFERLAGAPPAETYGSGLGSNYQGQGLKLSKHFKV